MEVVRVSLFLYFLSKYSLAELFAFSGSNFSTVGLGYFLARQSGISATAISIKGPKKNPHINHRNALHSLSTTTFEVKKAVGSHITKNAITRYPK